ncbi:hypothetical protein [Deinococcus peraridilitoris]|uniref:Uncharacterized protein n=1 Tax=Deinococcus peraridilitoris (strain DSM 19664 / LMG 22246 / CIP 109416 / KR-200) TaxID=937777 RepID=L0A9B3_DEIPD|nr:hypothetical protein [Deinococcus peraridilitoris]AFZ69625.1 hypothetical protein Deipe_4282 [Deinococcus peraridilitoris DSM 19664]
MRHVTRQSLLSKELRDLVLDLSTSLEDALKLVNEKRGTNAGWMTILIRTELQQLRTAEEPSGS